MFGLYNGSQASESIRQIGLTRHQILQVNCGSDLTHAWRVGDCSGMASVNPNVITAGSVNAVTPKGIEGGPHFVMSPETPDGAHTYGLEFCLIDNTGAALSHRPIASNATSPGTGGYSVTLWCLIAETQSPKPNASLSIPFWACLQTVTGVNNDANFSPELYHTFDINSQAIRFQIGNIANDPTTNNESIIIVMAEL